MTDPDATPAADADPRRRDRHRRGAALRLRRQPARPGRPVGEHALPVLPRHGHRALRLPGPLLSPDTRTAAVRSCQAQSCPASGRAAPAEVRTGNDLAAYQSRLPRRRGHAGGAPPAGRGRGASPGRRRRTPPRRGAMPWQPLTAGPRRSTSRHGHDLTAEQQQRARRRGRRACCAPRSPASLPAFPTDPAGHPRDQSVAGAFVSLKRGRHLRSCCGLLGQPVPLRQRPGARRRPHRLGGRRVSRPSRRPSWTTWTWKSGCCTTPSPLRPRRGAGRRRSRSASTASRWCAARRTACSCPASPSTRLGRAPLPRPGLRQGRPAATAWRDDDTALFTFEGEVRPRPAGDGGRAPTAGSRPGVCRPEDAAGLRRLLPRQPDRPAQRHDAQLLLLGRRRRHRQRRRPHACTRPGDHGRRCTSARSRCGPAAAQGDAVRPDPGGGPAAGRRSGCPREALGNAPGRPDASCTTRCCTAPSPTRTWPASTRGTGPSWSGAQQVRPAVRSAAVGRGAAGRGGRARRR